MSPMNINTITGSMMSPNFSLHRVTSGDRDSEAENVEPTLKRTLFSSPSPSPSPVSSPAKEDFILRRPLHGNGASASASVSVPLHVPAVLSRINTSPKHANAGIKVHGNILFPTARQIRSQSMDNDNDIDTENDIGMDMMSPQSTETFITDGSASASGSASVSASDDLSPLATPNSTPGRKNGNSNTVPVRTTIGIGTGVGFAKSLRLQVPVHSHSNHPAKSASASASASHSSPPPSVRISRKRTSSDLKKKRTTNTNTQMTNTSMEQHDINNKATCTSTAGTGKGKVDQAFQLRHPHLNNHLQHSNHSFDSHDSNHSHGSTSGIHHVPSTSTQQLFINSWLKKPNSGFTGSPIDEQNFNSSLDLSMDDHDHDNDDAGDECRQDQNNAAKIRKLNLDLEMDMPISMTTSMTRSMPMPLPMSMSMSTSMDKPIQLKLFASPEPEEDHDRHRPNNNQMAMTMTTTTKRAAKREEDNFISPNDVMTDHMHMHMHSIPHKPPSPPTFDFESDVISPPATRTLQKKAGDGDDSGNANANAPNDDFVSPTASASASASASSPFQQDYTSFYGNHSNQARTITRALPKTPMLERKAPRRRHHESSTTHTYNQTQEISRFNQDFEILDTIGNGSFGTVYKCKSRLDGCTYAIKTTKRRARGTADRERMLQEVKALAVLSDVSDVAAFHIVRYHQAWIGEDDRLHIVTDLCTSTLQNEIDDGLIKSDTRRQYKLLREMLLALKLIHQHGKVHLDIKPENIFVKDQLFKLGDFGLVIDETTVGEVEEGDCRFMCMDLFSGNHRDLTKVRKCVRRGTPS
jgi:tRNA A-37 threonylcarbamoyl transferase component Bud32